MFGRQTENVQMKGENQRNTEFNNNSASKPRTHDLFLPDVGSKLEAARPRLLRFAHIWGVMPDSTDDVVQETLLEAWRSLGHLCSPERFDAWLLGICRNVCRRWAEREQRQERRLGETRDAEDTLAEDIVDPLASDPAEALSRQDLVTLLDRALGYLPDTTRSALELCYVAELPQREVALRLGLTINALEVRLHRARRQLRQILSTQLRTDAEEYGLILNEGRKEGWCETRIWCMFCARHHLHGLFEPFPDGRINLRLRCPSCASTIGSPEQEGGLTYSGGMFELRGLRAYRPAFNRTIQGAETFWTLMRQRQTCLHCGSHIQAHLLGPDERIPPLPRWSGLMFATYCPGCEGVFSTYASWSAWSHPRVQEFMKEHPRWICEPEVIVEYAGHPAVRARFVDITSATRLLVLIHTQTMEVLATICE
ncbi:MAG: RNA polymerase sigma factor [Chloroflexota bacterium]|nr:RNA polymerase sigma factor [Chloroflexota bacterium]